MSEFLKGLKLDKFYKVIILIFTTILLANWISPPQFISQGKVITLSFVWIFYGIFAWFIDDFFSEIKKYPPSTHHYYATEFIREKMEQLYNIQILLFGLTCIISLILLIAFEKILLILGK